MKIPTILTAQKLSSSLFGFFMPTYHAIEYDAKKFNPRKKEWI